MKTIRTALLLACAGLLGLAANQPRRLSVAAASDLQAALPALATAFEARHPGIQPQFSFGSSGTFTTQILNGAPFDMFFSADRAYPRQIIQAGLADPASEFLYGRGRLALWVRKDSGIPVQALGWKALEHPKVRRIALANPRHAPYGRAAEEALRARGLLEGLRSRLVFGENISQTAQFVQTGHAELGILAVSLAMGPGLRDEGDAWMLPAESYAPLEQTGVILKRTQDLEAARTFRAFVLSTEGSAILRRFGLLSGAP